MALVKGDTLRLEDVDYSKALYVDWINARHPVPGDIAVVSQLFSRESGCVVCLVCEPRPGFQEWSATFHEADLTYELVNPPSS